MTSPYIDAHVHLEGSCAEKAKTEQSLEALFIEMQKAGIQKSILIPFDHSQSNAMIADICKRYPDKLTAFCLVDFFSRDWSGYLKELEHCICDMGFKGLKIHPRYQGISLSDSRLKRLVSIAGKYKIPIIIDCILSRGRIPIKETLPLLIDELAFENPDASLIIAHMGGHRVLDSYSIVKNNPNVYLDLSSSIIKYQGSSVITDIEFTIRELAPLGKLIFGSDFPTFSILQTYKLYEQIFVRHKLCQKDIDAIMGGTMCSLLSAK